jgi:hypothetical protein
VARPEERRIGKHEFRREQPIAQETLLAVKVAEDGVEHRDALDDGLFNLQPFGAPDHEGHEVHQPRTLLALWIRVHVVGDAIALNQPLTGLLALLELRVPHPAESRGDANPVRTEVTGCIQEFVPVTLLRGTVCPVGVARGAGRRMRVAHVVVLRPGTAHVRRRSRVDGKSGFSADRGVSMDPGVWPIAKNRARRRASASFEFTGNVA